MSTVEEKQDTNNILKQKEIEEIELIKCIKVCQIKLEELEVKL